MLGRFVMVKKYEIFFSDLNEEAQKELLEDTGISDPKEMNWDIFPLTSYEFFDIDDDHIGEEW